MSAHVRTWKVVMAAAVMTLAGAVALAADTGLNEIDRDFMGKAAQGSMMEIAVGKLAATRAQDPAVRSFAQRLVADHSRASDGLKALADAKQLTLPDAVTAEDQVTLGKLEGLNGAEFDQSLADLMVKDHVTDIKDFQKEIKSGHDADVKAFAEQTLPTLRHHLTMANQLSKQQKKGTSS
jgi:putative membrane protein